MIEIHVDTKGATQFLDDVQKRQIPFATAVALTRTARLVRDRLKRELIAKLDNPSPYTTNSTFSTSANKTDLQAIVGIKDKGQRVPPAVLLKELFSGGVRGHKPMEKAMESIGALPPGWRVVPGSGMPLDSYGNPKRAVVKEIIGSMRSGAQIYKGRGKKVALVGYFIILVGARSHLVPGIYWRSGRAIKPMFVFIKTTHYTKRIDLPGLADDEVSRSFESQFRQALASAIASAR